MFLENLGKLKAADRPACVFSRGYMRPAYFHHMPGPAWRSQWFKIQREDLE